MVFLIGKPGAGSAIDNQPQSLIGLILDIVLNVWLISAIGEEFIFRGIIVNRCGVLFKNFEYSAYEASVVQAIWFGMAHESQGLVGISITGIIGFALASIFFNFLNLVYDQSLWLMN